MAKKPPIGSNHPDSDLAKLQSELRKARESIEKLQRRNSDLQKRIAVLENKPPSLPAQTSLTAQKMRMTRKERFLFRRRAAKRRRLVRLAISSSILLLGMGGIAIAINRWLFSTPVSLPVASDPVKLPSASASSSPSPTPTPLTRATLVYSPVRPPEFKKSEGLQNIVDSAVNLAEKKGLPTDRLAITLIDAKNNEIAGYRQTEARYPASVVKMFWLVAFYAQKEAGILTEDTTSTKQIENTIYNSDNDDAAFILDKISNAKSQPRLEPEKFKVWLEKRKQVNNFFTKAGFQNINITQKTYPVYSQDLESPRGTELQIRAVPELSQANQFSTDNVARLIYEICFSKQAVSPTASAKMCGLLTRDLKPESWKKQAKTGGFHPIYGLLGEAFPNADVTFASKAGGTSTSRQDAAFIQTKDGKIAYVLAVFGNDGSYAGDGSIFPEISRLVFRKMKERVAQ